MKVKSEGEVAQSCPTLSDPMDYSPPGPSSMKFSRQEYWSGMPLPSALAHTKFIIIRTGGWKHPFEEFASGKLGARDKT